MATSRYRLDGFTLDAERRELARDGVAVDLPPQALDLLLFLVRNRERVLSKDDLIDGAWGGRIVSNSTLTTHLNTVRRALGDTGEAQRYVRTFNRKGVRFVGTAQEDEPAAAVPPAPAPAPTALTAKAPPQDIRFIKARDGVRLAMASTGSGPVLVKPSNWMNHVERDFDNPIWSSLFARLATNRRLIRYDGRGIGLSDWTVDEVSFEAFVGDLEAVIEASGAKKVSLLGASMGGATAMAYAARHPERVERLILHGCFAIGRRRRRTNVDVEKAELFLSLLRNGWGTTDSAFMKAFACVYFPQAPTSDLGWFVELQNRSATASNAVRVREACDLLDVSPELGRITAPTLVLHSTGDLVVPMDQGRSVAAAIPDARFVPLDSANHVLTPADPAWPRFVEAIEHHLAGSAAL